MQLQLITQPQKEIVLPPLRDYQEKMRRDLYAILREHWNTPCEERTVCMALPTGGGKTLTSTRFMVDALMNSGRKSLFIVSLTCLVKQTYETFKRYNIDAGVIAASFNRNRNPHPNSPIQIASIDTLVNRQIPDDIGLVVIDEAHTCCFPQSQRWVFDKKLDGTWKHWKADAWIIGLTATPWRTKKAESLADLYKHLVVGPQARDLMELGRQTDFQEGLTEAIYYGLPKSKQLNLSGIRTVMGDYNNDQLSVVVDNDDVTRNLVEQWVRLCASDGILRNARRTAFFGVNVAHSMKVADFVNNWFREQAIAEGFENGCIAKHLDGTAPTEEREYWFEKLKRGDIRFFSSVDIASTGFDVPEIECVIPRPTKSKVVNIQQVGRGARCAPWIGKRDFLVLDIGRNAENHKIGRIDDEQDYSLNPAEKKEPGEAPMKQCPSCDALVYAFFQECPHCGHVFESQGKPKELPIGEMKVILPKEDLAKKKFYRSKARMAFRKGYSPGFAMMKFKEEFKKFPSSIHTLHAVFDEEDVSELEMRTYWDYLCKVAEAKEKDLAWCTKFYRMEFGGNALDPKSFTD